MAGEEACDFPPVIAVKSIPTFAVYSFFIVRVSIEVSALIFGGLEVVQDNSATLLPAMTIRNQNVQLRNQTEKIGCLLRRCRLRLPGLDQVAQTAVSLAQIIFNSGTHRRRISVFQPTNGPLMVRDPPPMNRKLGIEIV